MKTAIVLRCVGGKLKTHLNLLIQDSAKYSDVCEQVLRWDNAVSLEIDCIEGKGNYDYKGNLNGQGKYYEKGKTKGKSKTKDGGKFKNGEKGYKGGKPDDRSNGQGEGDKSNRGCLICGKYSPVFLLMGANNNFWFDPKRSTSSAARFDFSPKVSQISRFSFFDHGGPDHFVFDFRAASSTEVSSIRVVHF